MSKKRSNTCQTRQATQDARAAQEARPPISIRTHCSIFDFTGQLATMTPALDYLALDERVGVESDRSENF